MIRVNLLATSPGAAPPREWLPREQRSAVVGLAMLIVTGVAVGGWWWYLQRAHAAVEVRITTANEELARLKKVATLVDQVTARKTDLTERLALIERLRATMRGPVDLLETVSRSVPEGLWLMEIKQQGTATQVEGRAMSLSSVTDFAELLQNSGLFMRPVEISTTTDFVDERSVVHFVMKAESAAAAAGRGTGAGAAGAGVTATGAPANKMETPAPVPAPAPAAPAPQTAALRQPAVPGGPGGGGI